MSRIGILCFILCNLIPNFGQCSEWAYSGVNGPSNWSRLAHNEKCGGMAQSPINIPAAASAAYDSNLEPFTLTGFSTKSLMLQLVNNGHTVQVNIPNGVEVSGGGLSQKHITAQLHFHWGDRNSEGSEHKHDGMAYPLEMHIVNYNSKYGNLTHAASQPDGLAVLGFWFEIGDDNNTGFSVLLDHLKDTMYKDEDTIMNNVVLSSLVLSKLDRYYRYKGSLTTPPCYESVTWTMFDQRISISQTQMDIFRGLYEEDEDALQNHKLVNNFRPVQETNGRVVYKSFSDSGTTHLYTSSVATIIFVYLLHLL